MHIGLYFGSFNPIHTGHLIIANHVLQHSDIDKVWFVLSPQNPLKPAATLLNEYDRLHLVELAIKDNPGFRASNVEFHLPKPSYTIDTLTYLREKFPHEKFFVILGSDSLQNIRNWKNWEALIAQYPLIIYKRSGYDALPPDSARAQIMDAPILDISAAFIRSQIRDKKSVQYLLPELVWKYVQENRYYL